MSASLTSAGCQPSFRPKAGEPLVQQAKVDGVRLGDVPLRIMSDERSQRALDALHRELPLRGMALSHSDSATTRLELRTRRSGDGEGYRVAIREGHILIEGEGPAGTFYGAMDLLDRLRPFGEHGAVLPFGESIERPLFAYRAMHLDVSRHFFPASEVERLVELFASFKINTLHLHLSDDQGFSLQLPQNPELASRVDGQLRAYSRSDIDGIVAFAAARFVQVVPEIDVPGHVRSWLVSKPQLACSLGERSFALAHEGGIYDEVLCAGSQETRATARSVLRQTAQLFPGPYLHLGGDEVPHARWDRCPVCQKHARFLRAHAMDQARAQASAENAAAAERAAGKVPLGTRLYDDFVRDMTRTVVRAGKQPIGWDEAAAVEDGPEIIQVWRDEASAAALLAQGKRVILSPMAQTYLNQQNVLDARAPGYQSELNWRQVARIDWRPLVRGARAGAVLGGAGALWTERVRSLAEAETLYFPRALVLSEVLWRGHFAPGDGEAGAKWLAARMQRLSAFGVQFFVAPPLGLLPRTSLPPGAALRLQAPLEHPGAVMRLHLGDGEPQPGDPSELSLPLGEHSVSAATFWNGRQSASVRGTVVVEPVRAGEGAKPGAERGCLATVQLGHHVQVASHWPSSLKTSRAFPCDPIAKLAKRLGTVRAEGAFDVERDGTVEFVVRSDDGAKLWVDGVLVVDHDGQHPATPKAGSIQLGRGRHRYELRYADVGGEFSLEVQLTGAAQDPQQTDSLLERSELP